MTQEGLIKLLNVAKEYVTHGMIIIPVRLKMVDGKKVITQKCKYADLTMKTYDWTIFKELCRRYRNNSGFNSLQLLVYKTPKIIIVDCDNEQAVEKIANLIGSSKTLRSKTARGIHYWFKTNEERPFHQNEFQHYDVPHNIFLPGSIVENNDGSIYSEYTWIDHCNIPPLPPVLSSYLNKSASEVKVLRRQQLIRRLQSQPASHTTGGSLSIIDVINKPGSEGARHDTLCFLVGKLKSKPYQYTRKQTMKFVLAQNRRVSYRKPENEICNIVNWIYDQQDKKLT